MNMQTESLLKKLELPKDGDTQPYKVILKDILKYENLSHFNGSEFSLKAEQNAFIQNAKAYTFEYLGVECAYVMTKVLGLNDYSLWLAIEIHKYKDSWGLDAGEISWLHIKSENVNNKLIVTKLNLLPLNLFTDFESVEITNALDSIESPFLDSVTLIESHSRIILNKFSSINSMYWIKELSTLGYTLSQFSQSKLKHPQTNINIKNALTPYLLNVDGEKYQAMSYLIQEGNNGGICNSLWLTHFKSNDQLCLDKILISFGQYASDLTICKAPNKHVVESSYFVDRNSIHDGDLITWFQILGLELSESEAYLKSLDKVIADLFNPDFINRLIIVSYFDTDSAIDYSELNIENIQDFKNNLDNRHIFKENAQMYYSLSSFRNLYYVPDMAHALFEDYDLNQIEESTKIQQAHSGEFEESSIYDTKQPDFNSETQKFIPKIHRNNQKPSHLMHSKHKIMRHEGVDRGSVYIEDTDEAIKKAESIKQQGNKKQFSIVHKHRFKGYVNQATATQIGEHIENVTNLLKEEGQVNEFLKKINQLPESSQEFLANLEVNQRDNLKTPKIIRVTENGTILSQSEINQLKDEADQLKDEADQLQDEADQLQDEVVDKNKNKNRIPRGRPKKQPPVVVENITGFMIKNSDELQDAHIESNQAAPVAAKKRGRPNKQALAAKESETNENIPAAPIEAVKPIAPKKRGRPSKQALAAKASETNENIPAAPVAAPKKRGRPSKQVLAAKVAETNQHKLESITGESLGNSNTQDRFILKVADKLKLIDSITDSIAVFSKKLIKDNPNYLLNAFIGFGVDKFKAVELLKKIGAEFEKYSFAELQRKIMQASESALEKYIGFENYIIECEYELSLRR